MAFGKVTKATTYISGGWDAFNTLITDLLSTSNSKGASQIGIEDSAGNMTAENVEDALAEIYSDTSTTVTLAETFAENGATTAGLTWGYKGGLFRLDAVVTDVSSGTIGLTDDATNYVEIDPSDGNVKKNTSAFTSGRIPLRAVITSSGSQTTSTDKRAWFSQVAAATTLTSGIVELSTDAEAIAGTSDLVVLTPGNLRAVLPPGIEMFWPTDTPPTGWLEEDGSAISRTTYAGLFAVIGTGYGVGDGSTTFNLPSPQGRAVRVWDNSAGVDPDAASRTDRGDGTTGDNVGTNQADVFKDHDHNTPSRSGYGESLSGSVTALYSASGGTSSGGNETRMINTNRMLIIKY